MRPIVVGAAFVVVVVAFDRIMVGLERRGWVNWRGRGGSAVGSALTGVQAIWEPSAQHVLDQQAWEQDRREDEGSGDPPEITLVDGRVYVYRPRE